MLRPALLVVVVASITVACSDQLGRDVPECAAGSTNSIVMEIQSVPTAAYVPCIDSLDVGWVYHDLVPRRGLAQFTLGSDRMGDPFLTVRTTQSCETSGVQVLSDERGMVMFRDVVEDFTVEIVVIPVGSSPLTSRAAHDVVAELSDARLNDRAVKASVDRQVADTAVRIQRSLDSGAHVILVDTRDAEEGTVTLVAADGTSGRPGSLRDAVKRIEAAGSPPSYTGAWFYVFDGGCTEYRFDAHGPGVEDVATDVRRALTFTDAEAIKDLARSAGYRVP